MKKLLAILAGVVATVTLATFAGCSVEFNPDKNISIIARDTASGTREAFDSVVTANRNYSLKTKRARSIFLRLPLPNKSVPRALSSPKFSPTRRR